MINDSPFPLAVAAQYLVLLKEAAYAPPDVTGDLEGGFKAPREQVIEAVVELIVNELKTGNAYLYYANALRDLSHHSIAEEFRDHAADETDHADYLMRRLSVIAGESVQLPDVPSPPALSDPAEIIATMIRIEQEGIAKWRLLRGMIGDENPMRYQVEHFLVTEQEHLDELHQLLPAAPAAPEPELGNPEAPPPKVASVRDRRLQALVSDVLEKRAADDKKPFLSDAQVSAVEAASRRLQGAAMGVAAAHAVTGLDGGGGGSINNAALSAVGALTGALVFGAADPHEQNRSLKQVREANARRVGGGFLGMAAGAGLREAGKGSLRAVVEDVPGNRARVSIEGSPGKAWLRGAGTQVGLASAMGAINQMAQLEQAKRRGGTKTASLGAYLRSKLAATMSDAMPAAQTALDHLPGARVAPGAGPLAPVQPVEPIPEGVPADLLDPGAEQQLAIEEQGRMQEAEEAASYFQEQAQGKEMLLQQLQQQLEQTAQQAQQTAQQLQQEQQEKQQAQQMVQQASSTANQALTGQLQAQQQALQSRQTATQALGTHESFRQQLRELIDPPPPAPAPMGGDPSMQPPPGAAPAGAPPQGAPPGAEQAMAPKMAAGLNDIPLDAAADVLKHGPKKTLLTVGLPAVVAAATGLATHLRHRNAPEAVNQAQQHLNSAERAYSTERSHTNAIKLLAAKAQVGAAEIARDYPTATAVAATGAGYGLARAAVGAGTNVHTRVSRMMENHRKSKGGRPNSNAAPDFAKGP